MGGTRVATRVRVVIGFNCDGRVNNHLWRTHFDFRPFDGTGGEEQHDTDK